VAFLDNVARADKLYCTKALQALYSEPVAPQDAITVIALVVLQDKFDFAQWRENQYG
jgi:hypothetical protein